MAKLIESLAISGSRLSDGTPNASGKVWIYVAGTTSPASVFSDADGSAVRTQPIVLDAAGRATLYVNQIVSVLVETAAGATVATYDLTDSPGVVRVQNAAFSGTLPSGSQGAGGDTDLDTVLTSAQTSFGGTDFTYLESTGATQRTVASWMREVHISVKDFGAKGDGIHDDTSAIQAAINEVVRLNGGIVKFPPGRYIISAALTNTSTAAVSFQGAGAYNCTIQQTSVTANALTLGNALQIGWFIHDLNITASPGTTGSGVSIVAGELIDIGRCYINNHKTCIAVPSTSFVLELSIHDNYLSTNSIASGIGVEVSGSGVDRCTIRDNTIFALSSTAINYVTHISETHVYGNRIGATNLISLPATAVSTPTKIFSNYRLTGSYLIAQAGTTAYFKQWGNGIDGVASVDGVNTAHTPDMTTGEELFINVNVGGLTITINNPAFIPIYRGCTITMKLWNNNAGVTTWAGFGGTGYRRDAVTPNINTAAGVMTTIVFEYSLDRALWIEKSRKETG